MSSSGNVKKISQGELRRLMNKHKDKLVDTVKKIESPLAKYVADGRLTCVLCDTIVRSEAVWKVHVNSKLHRDNIHVAKQMKLSSETSPTHSSQLKRPHDQSEHDPAPPKKIKGILKNAPTNPIPTLPKDIFNSVESPGNLSLDLASKVQPVPNELENENGNGSGIEDSEMEKEASSGCDIRNDSLPEGFFDDPKMDAKARNVEYKDPIEEEWERFQKEIKEEVTFSTQIIEEDHEEATAERQIEEIDEQLRNWNRVLELERKKEAVKAAERFKMEVEEELSSGEEDFDEFLDWRAKKSYT